MSKTTRQTAQGFTLVELVVAVAILAILASIAYPSYIDYVVKGRRVAAAGCMLEQAQFMERYYSANMSYAGATLPNTCAGELDGHYVIGFSAGPAAASYTISATPQGVQASRDADCGTLSVNERGTKSVSGGNSGNPAACF